MNLYMLMLHRILVMKKAVVSTIRDAAYIKDVPHDDEVKAAVANMDFWTGSYHLVQYMMSLLR